MPLELAPRAVIARRAGDTWYLASPQPLRASRDRLFDLVRRAAAQAPDRDFLVERRADGSLRRVTWGEALAFATGLAEWLIAEHPVDARVLALSGNSIDHALLMLGCYAAGVPFVPVSPAYALLSQDFAKLRVVVAKVAPAVVFADRRAPFARALDALGGSAEVVSGAELATRVRGGDRLAAREAAITPDHVAKILFTSGSTAFPKGVPNTHGMLVANQQMIAQCWPFLATDEPPVLVDWLPWSHTFGGNHNFNLVLRHGGTLFIDEGRPTPTGIDATLRNLATVSPTLYFNVPAGYAALVPRLEADPALARAFFARLRVMFYAAAALPPDLWQRLTALARASTDREVFMTTAWGSTETSPLATSTHFAVPVAGNIGLPAPGVTLKLVPSGAKLEVRVHGPSVMRGYLDEPALTAAAFDDEGFYRIGDAVRFADPERPDAGLYFDGRIAEDFKLASGTWVSVTTIRTGVVAAAGGALADVVVCGHDRAALAVLAWPSVAGCEAQGLAGATLAELADSPAVHARVAAALAAWNAANPSSSTRVARAVLLTSPPDLDAGEITDKGYVNQRVALARRADDVACALGDDPGPRVVTVDDQYA